MIRHARAEDQGTVEAIVHAAYSVYVERIGKPPGPMLDDYALLIDEGLVSLFEDGDGTVAGLLVLIRKAGYLLLDNIAVRPDRQGRGIGRRLIAFAVSEARRFGYAELRLYTHRKMIENIALYARVGFVEIGRGHDGGYDRIFMAKPMGNFP